MNEGLQEAVPEDTSIKEKWDALNMLGHILRENKGKLDEWAPSNLHNYIPLIVYLIKYLKDAQEEAFLDAEDAEKKHQRMVDEQDKLKDAIESLEAMVKNHKTYIKSLTHLVTKGKRGGLMKTKKQKTKLSMKKKKHLKATKTKKRKHVRKTRKKK